MLVLVGARLGWVEDSVVRVLGQCRRRQLGRPYLCLSLAVRCVKCIQCTHPEISRTSIEIETQVLSRRSNTDRRQVHGIVLHIISTDLANLVTVGTLLLQHHLGMDTATDSLIGVLA